METDNTWHTISTKKETLATRNTTPQRPTEEAHHCGDNPDATESGQAGVPARDRVGRHCSRWPSP